MSDTENSNSVNANTGDDSTSIRKCGYFNTPRGCAKGDLCNFAHVVEEKSANDTGYDEKICQYYLAERGCVKGDGCDFKHPVAPNGEVTKNVCSFFGVSRGCAKAHTCNFLHISRRNQSRMGLNRGMPGPMGGMPTGMMNVPPGKRLCNFYMAPEGCRKGGRCTDFHPGFFSMMGGPGWAKGNHFMGGAGFGRGGPMRKRPKPCSYYLSPRGCVKGVMCDFLHVRDEVCSFWKSDQGCKKGDICDFRHSDEPLNNGGQQHTSNSNDNGRRYAPY